MARQAVTLTGLGADGFNLITHSATKLHAIFSRYIPEGLLEPWTPTILMQNQCINTSNRYFSNRRFMSTILPQQFSRYVDPKGYLQENTSDRLVHTIDNDVQYFQCTLDIEAQKVK
jgi:hypothetical protein